MRRFIFITLGLALVGCTVIPPSSPNDVPQTQNVPLSENETPAAAGAGIKADFPDLGPAVRGGKSAYWCMFARDPDWQEKLLETLERLKK